MVFSPEDIMLLERHVTNLDKNVYLIKNLPPEVVAVLFAYVSRSPASFRENLLKLVRGKEFDMGALITGFEETGLDYSEAKKKAREFHEKWVVGYGHASVAEHAVCSIALENVSILATKVIEDNRLASYTEKSTRYQVFSKSTYYKPKSVMASRLGRLYEETCDHLFEVYGRLTPRVLKHVEEGLRKEEETKGGIDKRMDERLYQARLRAKTCDVVRYLLPTATLTNLAMTANARVLEHAITKLLSHELEEMRALGALMKEEVEKIVPTLVKYAGENPYYSETHKEMRMIVTSMGNSRMSVDAGEKRNTRGRDTSADKRSRAAGEQGETGYEGSSSKSANGMHNNVQLVGYDHDAEETLAAALMYRYSSVSSGISYKEAQKRCRALSPDDRRALITAYVERMGKHDWPMRELEHVTYMFDVLIDYGAYRDIQRHRMCTQTDQGATAVHGYAIPPEICAGGFEKEYCGAMERAREAFARMSADFPLEAQYVVPLAFRKRTLFTMNLREAFHFIQLRSGKGGHISYRKIAQEMYDEIVRVHPFFADFLRVTR